MSEIGSAFVSIVPSAKGFSSKLEAEAGGGLRGVGSKLGGLLKLGLLAGVAGAGAALVSGLNAAADFQKLNAQTAAVIKSTGSAAGVTAQHVQDLSNKIAGYSDGNDDAITAGQNLLLTFTNIQNGVGKGNQIFDRTTKTLADMSIALGQDTKSSALQLGKALNDPIKGVSALQRVGVSFTEAQKDQIKALVDSGKTMQAQKLILGELGKEFGGSAKAVGKTFAGSLGRLKDTFGDLLRDGVTPLLPKLTQLSNFLAANLPGAIAKVGAAFGQAKAFIAPFVAQIGALFSGGGGAGLSGFATAISANLLPVLATMGQTFTTVVLPAVKQFVTYLATTLGPVIAQVASVITTTVLPILSSLAQFFYGTLYPAIISVVRAVAENLKPVFDQYVATVQGTVLPIVQQLLEKFREYQPTIQKVVGVVVVVIGKILELAAAILGKVLPVAIKLIGFLIQLYADVLVGVIKGIVGTVKAIINFGTALYDGITAVLKFEAKVVEKIGSVISTLAKLPKKALTALGDFASTLFNAAIHAGQQFLSGLAQGLADAVGLSKITGAVSSIAGSIKDHFPGSPVKTGPLVSWNNGGAGRRLMDMLAKGITDGSQSATDAAAGAAQKIVDAVKERFSTIKDAVTSAFTGDLFSGFDTAKAFTTNLGSSLGNIVAVAAAFKKLLAEKVPIGFLSTLFQSGNSALILDLANGPRGQAIGAAQDFSTINSLTSQLSSQVAGASIGPDLKGIRGELEHLNKKTDKLPGAIGQAVGKAINGAASNGHRKKAA